MTTPLRPCTCRNFEAGTRVDVAGGDVDFINVRTTGCKASTTRLFAQGHDAKLVSFLVQAELDNLEIALTGQGSSWGRAQDAAFTVSLALSEKAAKMIETARAKQAAKASKPARESRAFRTGAARTQTPETTPTARMIRTEAEVKPEAKQVPARIKVGRWTYDATINSENGDATYTRKLGGEQTISRVEYTVV